MVNNGTLLYLEVLESVRVRPNQEHVAPLEAGCQLLRPSYGISDVAVAEVNVHLEGARSPNHAYAFLENQEQDIEKHKKATVSPLWNKLNSIQKSNLSPQRARNGVGTWWVPTRWMYVATLVSSVQLFVRVCRRGRSQPLIEMDANIPPMNGNPVQPF